MYVEEFVSGQHKVEAAPQSHLPQLLGSLVSVETVVAQEEANYKRSRQQSACYDCDRLRKFTLKQCVY